ncbi:MAG: hypothetical protein U9P88_02625, partial [Patescibacteria group bacterium]|nr:hypothetical protein [Patescibacteria group bacterium]
MIKLKSLKIKNNTRLLFGVLIVLSLLFILAHPAIVSAQDATKKTAGEIFEGMENNIPMAGGAKIVAESDPLGTIVVHFGTAIIGGVIHLIAACTAAITVVAGYILKYATDPNFLSFMPYTSVTDNPVINAGWPITRGLSYAFIAIGIMIIGVATALRIEGYGAKKALPLLIIMAILVNFTPVICGVFVDASNLLMNFFLKDIEPSTFAKNQIALQQGIIS